MRRLGLLLISTLLLAACGDEGPPADGAGDVPITQRAIAAMALEHAPDDTSTREATYTDRSDPNGAIGADLRYRGGDGDDGDLLRIYLTPPQKRSSPCGDDEVRRCESREVDQGTLTLAWDVEAPQEDPGYVAVVLERADETVMVYTSGEVIEGDPREQELSIPIDTLEAIAQDRRISLTTSQEVVDAGEELDDWDGGEPDPRAYDRVPSTDEAVARSYWRSTGGYGAYHRLRPSPLKAELGAGAIGGRFDRERLGRDFPPVTIDVLASPQRPAWMAEDVCATERFAGHCVQVDGHKGPRYFAWVPGPEGVGETWSIGVRKDELVAIRYGELAVPADQAAAEAAGEWDFNKRLLESRLLGLETDKELVGSEA